MSRKYIVLCALFAFLFAFVSHPALAQDSDCVIPDSGPWPPCATGGNSNPPPPPTAGNDDCVIPDSGPWPPCATGGGSTNPSPPSSDGGDCVIPDSGPWPPCATSGGSNENPAQPPSSGGNDDCVIPDSGPWPPCATGGSNGNPTPTPPTNPAPPVDPAPPAIVVTGSGDDVVTVERVRKFEMVRIIGNSCSRHFAVWSLDSSLENVDLLVNTTDPYSGVVLIDIAREDTLAGFEISSECNWSIEFLPLSAARVLNTPGSINGANDDIVAVLSGGILNVVGNGAERHFAIWAYDARGNRLDLLVNTTDAYSGNVRVPNGTRYLSIDAEGGWTLTYP